MHVLQSKDEDDNQTKSTNKDMDRKAVGGYVFKGRLLGKSIFPWHGNLSVSMLSKQRMAENYPSS